MLGSGNELFKYSYIVYSYTLLLIDPFVDVLDENFALALEAAVGGSDLLELSLQLHHLSLAQAGLRASSLQLAERVVLLSE